MSRPAGVLLLLAAMATAACPAAGQAPLLHHDLQAHLDPASGRLQVADTVTLEGRKALRFRLAPWMRLEEMRLDGRRIAAEPAAGSWFVALPDGGRHELSLRLVGSLPALRPEAARGGSGAAGAGPEGSYLPGWAGWLPVTDDDWVTYRLSIEVPTPFRAVATGRLEEEATGEAASRAVFAADYPSEPPSLFVGPYSVSERIEGRIRLRTYFHPDLADHAEAYLAASAGFLARFEAAIGPYPFRDFHVISSPLPVGLGFANLTYIGGMIVPLPFMRARSLAHEVLHNWWGNGVAVAYAGGNWAEGLTTYMADYALAADEGPGAAQEMRLGWLRDYAALPAARDAAVVDFTAKRHEAAQVIGYNKVAFIFHMLSREIGAAAFAEALAKFWQRHRFRVAGWAELRQAFEVAAGRDLRWFFEQWLTRVGAPRLSLGAVAARAEAAHYRLDLTLRQDLPAYRLSVPVVIETAEGREERFVLAEGPETSVSLTLASEPLAVHIDAEHHLFRRLLPGEAPPILRDVTLAADSLTVIAAAEEQAAGTARQLAERLLDTPLRLGSGDPAGLGPTPLLLIGTTPEVEGFLAAAGLAGVPESLAGRGTARVWTARHNDGLPLLAVAANDAAALQALLRPLPHYGSRSYLVFDGRRALETGTWPVDDSPLSRRLDR